MKFIFEEISKPKPLFLKDVEANQFFVNYHGSLCQKTTQTSFSVIAGKDGKPLGYHFANMPENTVINKILPKVAKIEF